MTLHFLDFHHSRTNTHRAGTGLEGCASLTNHEYERLFFKNDFSFGVTILNIYMVRLSSSLESLEKNPNITHLDTL
jgi:hypothetical protein